MKTLTPSTLIDMETLEAIAPVIRNAAHPLRLRILDYLFASRRSRTVREIMEVTGAPQAIVSQHLRILRDQRILRARRQGPFVYYEVRNLRLRHLLSCIRQHQGADSPDGLGACIEGAQDKS